MNLNIHLKQINIWLGGEIMKTIKELLDSAIITTLDNGNNSDNDFVVAVKDFFSIQGICLVLKINRNRYNYLARTNQLDNEIIKLRVK